MAQMICGPPTMAPGKTFLVQEKPPLLSATRPNLAFMNFPPGRHAEEAPPRLDVCGQKSAVGHILGSHNQTQNDSPPDGRLAQTFHQPKTKKSLRLDKKENELSTSVFELGERLLF